MDYWDESLREVFDEYKIDVPDGLIQDIKHIAEMESEACGHLCIPNPLEAEIKELQSQKKKLQSDWDKQVDGVRDCLQKDSRVHVSERVVIASDGNVTIHAK